MIVVITSCKLALYKGNGTVCNVIALPRLTLLLVEPDILQVSTGVHNHMVSRTPLMVVFDNRSISYEIKQA